MPLGEIANGSVRLPWQIWRRFEVVVKPPKGEYGASNAIRRYLPLAGNGPAPVTPVPGGKPAVENRPVSSSPTAPWRQTS